MKQWEKDFIKILLINYDYNDYSPISYKRYKEFKIKYGK